MGTRPVCVLAAFAVAVVHGFAPPFHTSISNIKIEHSRRRPHDARPHCARLSTTLKEKKESIPNNLLVESVAPFRGLRLLSTVPLPVVHSSVGSSPLPA